MNRLLVFCFEPSGGLADYAHAQCEAFAKHSVDVVLLAPSDFIHRSSLYTLCRQLPPTLPLVVLPRFLRRLYFAYRIILSTLLLAHHIKTFEHQNVLWTSFTEYLAPFWAWRFRRLCRSGVVFGSIVHDPVRGFCVGPRWWHRFSIAEGYSFLTHAFVHAPIVLDTVRAYPNLQIHEIPHGPFAFPPSSISRDQLRASYGIPRDAPLLLSFGRLRVDKNLDRVLEAVSHHSQVHLLIAGPEATPGQPQSSDYQRLAFRLGIASRCHWQIHFHAPMQVSELFTIADVVVLAYSATFHSASGVLNIVSNFNLPVIVSAGDSPLLSAVHKYSLGLTVPPDDTIAISDAISRVLRSSLSLGWSSYLRDHSWDANASRVLHAFSAYSHASGN